LRIGCVKYLNARPLIHGWPGAVTLDHPAVLSNQLARGELDVALVSSFEFLRNPIYKIIDGISISSDGPVYSVVVAYRGETPAPEVELDPASQTSVVLLQYLTRRSGRELRPVQPPADLLSEVSAWRARLLIGDQAIRFRHKFRDQYRYWDLGDEWKRLTNLPFVYALWLVRPEASDTSAIAQQLRFLRAQNLQRIDELIANEPEFDAAFCRRYYSEYLRFAFGDQEKQGLLEFAHACVELDLFPRHKFNLQLV
jgi:chorismate dehydratase